MIINYFQKDITIYLLEQCDQSLINVGNSKGVVPLQVISYLSFIYRLVRERLGPRTGGSNETREAMWPYPDDILDHIRMFWSIIII